MSPEQQTIVALVIVASAAGWLIARVWIKRRNPGCGDECGCPHHKIEALVIHQVVN